MNQETIVLLDQAAGQKQIAILEVLKKKYNKRIIIAGTINERQLKLSDDITWEKVTPYNRSSLFARFFSWIIFTLQSFFLLVFKYRNADLFIVTNPPTSIFLTLLCRNKFDVLVFDLYPDALLEYKYVQPSSLIYKFWEKLNVKIFKQARRIFTLSEGMAIKLSAYVDIGKIEIVPLWTDNSYLKPISKDNNFLLKDLNLQDKFIVMYSGNMGLTHPVEILYDLAIEMKNEYDIFFLLIGGGHKYKELENKIYNSGLQNIKIMPWLRPSDLPYSMNLADVGIVTLDAEASALSVPSKIFDLFSVGKPVLAVGSADSELSKLLNKYQAGKCFKVSDLGLMKEYLLTLKSSPDLYRKLADKSIQASLMHTPQNAEAFL